MQVSRDENRIPAILGVLNTNGSTPISVYADPSTHEMYNVDGTGQANNGGTNAVREENRVTAFIGVSATDGTTPVPIYVDSSHQMLMKFV